MRALRSSSLRSGIATLLVALFVFQTAAVNAAESSLWSDRRRAIASAKPQVAVNLDDAKGTRASQGSRSSDGATLLASLPAIAPGLNTVQSPDLPLISLPSLDPSRSVPSWVQLAVTPFATIQSARLTGNAESPTVIIMQDAHLHAEAQHNIAGTIEAIAVDMGKRGEKLLVAMEGAASGPVDFSGYAASDAKIRREVANEMADRKILSGAEVAAVATAGVANGKDLFSTIGAENFSMYEANVRALRETAPMRPAADLAISDLRRELVDLKKKNFDVSLIRFDGRKAAYEDGKLGLPSYALFLDSEVPAQSKNLRELIEAALLEATLKFPKVEAERRRLLATLVEKMSDAEVKGLLQVSLSFRSGQVTYADYYDLIKRLAGKHDIKLSAFPEMNIYIQYVLKAEGIDHRAIFAELAEEERLVQKHLASTDPQRELLLLDSDVHLLRKLVDRTLIEAEWHTFESRATEIDKLLDRIAALGGHKPESATAMAPKWKEFGSFYTSAIARNGAMTANLDEAVKKAGASYSLVVAGGFHTDGLAALMAKRGYNVFILSPHITNLGDGPSSLDFLAEGRLPLNEIFVGEKLFLPTPPVTALRGAVGDQSRGVRTVAGLVRSVILGIILALPGLRASAANSSADAAVTHHDGLVFSRGTGRANTDFTFADGTVVNVQTEKPATAFSGKIRAFAAMALGAVVLAVLAQSGLGNLVSSSALSIITALAGVAGLGLGYFAVQKEETEHERVAKMYGNRPTRYWDRVEGITNAHPWIFLSGQISFVAVLAAPVLVVSALVSPYFLVALIAVALATPDTAVWVTAGLKALGNFRSGFRMPSLDLNAISLSTKNLTAGFIAISALLIGAVTFFGSVPMIAPAAVFTAIGFMAFTLYVAVRQRTGVPALAGVGGGLPPLERAETVPVSASRPAVDTTRADAEATVADEAVDSLGPQGFLARMAESEGTTPRVLVIGAVFLSSLAVIPVAIYFLGTVAVIPSIVVFIGLAIVLLVVGLIDENFRGGSTQEPVVAEIPTPATRIPASRTKAESSRATKPASVPRALDVPATTDNAVNGFLRRIRTMNRSGSRSAAYTKARAELGRDGTLARPALTRGGLSLILALALYFPEDRSFALRVFQDMYAEGRFGRGNLSQATAKVFYRIISGDYATVDAIFDNKVFQKANPNVQAHMLAAFLFRNRASDNLVARMTSRVGDAAERARREKSLKNVRDNFSILLVSDENTVEETAPSATNPAKFAPLTVEEILKATRAMTRLAQARAEIDKLLNDRLGRLGNGPLTKADVERFVDTVGADIGRFLAVITRRVDGGGALPGFDNQVLRMVNGALSRYAAAVASRIPNANPADNWPERILGRLVSAGHDNGPSIYFWAMRDVYARRSQARMAAASNFAETPLAPPLAVPVAAPVAPRKDADVADRTIARDNLDVAGDVDAVRPVTTAATDATDEQPVDLVAPAISDVTTPNTQTADTSIARIEGLLQGRESQIPKKRIDPRLGTAETAKFIELQSRSISAVAYAVADELAWLGSMDISNMSDEERAAIERRVAQIYDRLAAYAARVAGNYQGLRSADDVLGDILENARPNSFPISFLVGATLGGQSPTVQRIEASVAAYRAAGRARANPLPGSRRIPAEAETVPLGIESLISQRTAKLGAESRLPVGSKRSDAPEKADSLQSTYILTVGVALARELLSLEGVDTSRMTRREKALVEAKLAVVYSRLQRYAQDVSNVFPEAFPRSPERILGQIFSYSQNYDRQAGRRVPSIATLVGGLKLDSPTVRKIASDIIASKGKETSPVVEAVAETVAAGIDATTEIAAFSNTFISRIVAEAILSAPGQDRASNVGALADMLYAMRNALPRGSAVATGLNMYLTRLNSIAMRATAGEVTITDLAHAISPILALADDVSLAVLELAGLVPDQTSGLNDTVQQEFRAVTSFFNSGNEIRIEVLKGDDRTANQPVAFVQTFLDEATGRKTTVVRISQAELERIRGRQNGNRIDLSPVPDRRGGETQTLAAYHRERLAALGVALDEKQASDLALRIFLFHELGEEILNISDENTAATSDLRRAGLTDVGRLSALDAANGIQPKTAYVSEEGIAGALNELPTGSKAQGTLANPEAVAGRRAREVQALTALSRAVPILAQLFPNRQILNYTLGLSDGNEIRYNADGTVDTTNLNILEQSPTALSRLTAMDAERAAGRTFTEQTAEQTDARFKLGEPTTMAVYDQTGGFKDLADRFAAHAAPGANKGRLVIGVPQSQDDLILSMTAYVTMLKKKVGEPGGAGLTEDLARAEALLAAVKASFSSDAQIRGASLIGVVTLEAADQARITQNAQTGAWDVSAVVPIFQARAKVLFNADVQRLVFFSDYRQLVATQVSIAVETAMNLNTFISLEGRVQAANLVAIQA